MGVVAELQAPELRLRVSGMTCAACARRVEAALATTGGVAEVEVDHASGVAVVRGAGARYPSFAELQAAVRQAGYRLDSESVKPERASYPRERLTREIALGVTGGIALLGFYLGVVTLAQGRSHAIELLLQDAWFVGPIAIGFGAQIGLFAHLRGVRTRAAKAGMAAGTGTSTAAMLACCAHHLTEILPLLGVSAAAVFLETFKVPLLWLGLTANAAGVAYLTWLVRRHGAMACHPELPRAACH